MKNLIALILFFSFLTACNKEEQNKNSVADISMGSYALSSTAAGVLSQSRSREGSVTYQSGDIIQRSTKNTKIIKEGNISVRTGDINNSKKKLDESVVKLNGYYERENLQKDETGSSYNLVIRVPAENFENLFKV